MSRSDFASFCNKANPQVILEFLIKEAHFSIWILGVVLHGDIVGSFRSCTQPTRHSKHLLTSTLSILLLVLLGQFFVYHNLWRFEYLLKSGFLRLLQSFCLLLNEFSIFNNEVLHN